MVLDCIHPLFNPTGQQSSSRNGGDLEIERDQSRGIEAGKWDELQQWGSLKAEQNKGGIGKGTVPQERAVSDQKPRSPGQ